MATRTITRTRQETVTVYECDWCATSAGRHPPTCVLCGRIACAEHRKAWHDDENGSDYPYWYCRECWSIGEQHREKVAELDRAIDKETEAWHRKAKEAAKETQHG